MSDDFEDLPPFPLPKPGPRPEKPAPATSHPRAIPSEIIFELLHRALNSANGIAINFESEGQAVNWHQRYNMVRASLMRRADAPQEFRLIAVRRDGKRVLFEPVDGFIKRLQIENL